MVIMSVPDRAAAQSTTVETNQIRLEIDDLRGQYDDISQAGPVAMMIVGYALAPLLLVGPAVLAIGNLCDEGSDESGAECSDLTGTGLILTGVGAAGAGLGIYGLIQAIDNGETRRSIRRRIQDRKDALDSLSVNLQLGRHAATVGVVGRF